MCQITVSKLIISCYCFFFEVTAAKGGKSSECSLFLLRIGDIDSITTYWPRTRVSTLATVFAISCVLLFYKRKFVWTAFLFIWKIFALKNIHISAHKASVCS